MGRWRLREPYDVRRAKPPRETERISSARGGDNPCAGGTDETA